jgi:hypothetical protein
MKAFESFQALDGCGPYGRHLTGATNWQKWYQYSIGHNTNISANFQLVANKDYLIPIPPPSEDISPDAIQVYIGVAGTTSFVRAAILRVENDLSMSLVVDAGEQASDAAPTQLVISHTSSKLGRNGRYFLALCGRGAVLPQLLSWTASNVGPSFLGADAATSFYNVGMLRYSRANAAFPAAYNGVFEALLTSRISGSGRLP